MNNLRRHWLRMLVGLVLAAPFGMHAAGMIDWDVLRTLEYFAYDARLKLTLPETVDQRVVIVDVDEKSLAAEGHWPWPRERMGRLVSQLFDEYGIGVLGFDMVFAEAERHAAFDALENMLRDQGQPELADRVATLTPRGDEQFAASLEGRPVALGYYFSGNSNSTGRLPEPYLPSVIAETMDIPAPRAGGYGANLPVLQDAAARAGFFDNPLSDDDGVFRRAPTLQSYQGDLYESLSMAVVQLHLEQPLSIGENNEWLSIGERSVPLDGNLAALVPYRGGQGSFPYVSATDVLNLSVPEPSLLKDAIVLVGITAPGLYDLRNTPVQKVYPSDQAATERFIHGIESTAAGFGLDHFGLAAVSFGYLRRFRLAYIKIDGSYIRGINATVDNQFLVQSVAGIAHGLDIQVIAESVETEPEWNMLEHLHVDAAQGYYVGHPGDRFEL